MMAGEHPSEPTLLAYVEDELEADERSEVERHLAACPACAEDVAAARVGRDALRAAAELDLPASARARLDGGADPGSRSRPSREADAAGSRSPRPSRPRSRSPGGIATVAVLNPGGGDDESAGDGRRLGRRRRSGTNGWRRHEESAPQEARSRRMRSEGRHGAARPRRRRPGAACPRAQEPGLQGHGRGLVGRRQNQPNRGPQKRPRDYASGSVRVLSKAPE